MLGILAMRFAATQFIKLLERVPELEAAAYALIAFIGVKMLMSIEYFGGIELEEWSSVAAMAISFGAAFLINYFKPKESPFIVE